MHSVSGYLFFCRGRHESNLQRLQAVQALVVLVLASAIKCPDVTKIPHREQNVTREVVKVKKKRGGVFSEKDRCSIYIIKLQLTALLIVR